MIILFIILRLPASCDAFHELSGLCVSGFCCIHPSSHLVVLFWCGQPSFDLGREYVPAGQSTGIVRDLSVRQDIFVSFHTIDTHGTHSFLYLMKSKQRNESILTIYNGQVAMLMSPDTLNCLTVCPTNG